MSVRLDGFPTINQQQTQTNDGDPPENALDACGAACELAIARWTLHRDLDLTVDGAKDQTAGQDYVGYLYVFQLVAWLNGRGLETSVHNTDNAAAAMVDIKAGLDAGQPSIVLHYSVPATQAGGHFCDAVGYDDDGALVRMNPWTVAQETLSAGDWAASYNSWYIRVLHGRYQPPTPAHQPGHYRMTTAQKLRPGPNAWPATGPLVAVGTPVHAIGGYTPHWRQVADDHGHAGWALQSNMQPV